jgi:hypothetical protein
VNNVTTPGAVEWASPLDRLWRLLTWPRLTVILLIWIAVVLALSVVIPQTPPHIEDPVVRSQWLASVPMIARPVVERLEVLGIFDILGSGWLRLPLVLWLAHSLVMLAHWAPAIWPRLKGRPGEMKPLGRSLQLDRSTAQSVEDARRELVGRLETQGYNLLPGDEPGTFIATRRRWSWLALAGIYLGLGLAALGLSFTNWLGQVQEVILQPGNPMPLPGAGAVNLMLDGVKVTGSNPLNPGFGLASVRLVQGVGEGRSLVWNVHRSRLLQGSWMTLVEFTPVVEVQAVDIENGSDVLLRPFSPRVSAQQRVRLPLSGDSESRFVGVPSQNVTVHIDLQAQETNLVHESPDASPPFSLSFFQGAEANPSGTAVLRSGEEAVFDGVRYLVTFDYNALLRINAGLWWMVVGAGWALTALGFILLVVAPPTYMRGNAQSEGGSTRISLSVDMWDGDQRRYQDLRRLVSDNG